MRRSYPRLLPSSSLKIIWDGNSIGYGTGTSDPTTKAPSARLADYAPIAGSGVTVANIAVAGQSVITLGTAPSTMVARVSTALVPQLAAGKLNLVICHEDVNELVQNSNNVTTAINGWKSYTAAIRAGAASAGKQVQIMRLTAEAGRASTQTDAQIIARNACRKAINDIVRRDFRAMGFDYLCDIARMYPYAQIEDADDYSAAAFAVWNARLGFWNKDDGQGIDYLHQGNAGSAYKALLVCSTALRALRPLLS